MKEIYVNEEVEQDYFDSIIDVWDRPRAWPTIAYIETTNLCNAKCVCCPVDRVRKPRGTMSLETFKKIADLLKSKNVPIGAMFCFGEPFLDPTLIEKCKYANSINAFTPGHIGFNTNVSLIKPELYEGIIKNTSNITLSFYNTGSEYNRMTGNLDWETNYKIALDFIKYRDAHYPNFEVFIGTNFVEGFETSKVREAFKDYRVKWAQDASINYGEREMLTGVIDRTILYNWWTCDGYKGAIQIKFDGGLEYCAYDIIGEAGTGGKTHFGNILTDEWDTLKDKFIKKWKGPSELCKRCDFFHKFPDIKLNGCKKPNPLPEDWYDWQKPYLEEGEDFVK